MNKNFFLTVNNDTVDLKSAINTLRGLEDTIIVDLIQIVITRQLAKERGIIVTDEELQTAVDEFRYLKNMETADAFNKYLADRKIGLSAFQNSMENILLKNKLIDSVSDDVVDAYIVENQLSMEKVELFNIRLDNEDTANEIKNLLDDDDVSFQSLAYEYSLDESSKIKGGYVGFLSRKDMTAEIEAAVFNAPEGKVIGPYKTTNGYNIFMVNKHIKPDKDDPELRLEIKSELLYMELNKQTIYADIKCSLFE